MLCVVKGEDGGVTHVGFSEGVYYTLMYCADDYGACINNLYSRIFDAILVLKKSRVINYVVQGMLCFLISNKLLMRKFCTSALSLGTRSLK